MTKQIPNYIIVHENGKLVQTTNITVQDKLHCNHGQSTIIDTQNFTQFIYGNWIKIKSLDY